MLLRLAAGISYLERAVDSLRAERSIDEALLLHLSVL
jgi:hypothetical protein